MTTQSGKPAVQSMGIWGGVIAVLPAVLEAVDILKELPGAAAPVISLVGGLLALYGRWNAKKPIKGVI